MNWGEEVLIALDQLGNALTPGGWADETISSRCYRLSATNLRWARLRKWVDWIALHVFRQTDHCYQAYRSEVLRNQLPPEFRD